ncbi:MAG: hexose kinase [Chloroflexi bacterium]|nr:hexose kinase [Chloroflexota bacterium]
MILCVTANAAIDKTAVISPFRLDQIHRAGNVLALPGGKGCNVARALKQLGEPSLVTGWVGGFAGQFIENGLNQEGIETAFVHAEDESRTCLSILDPVNHTMTEIYEKGAAISAEKLGELIDWFRGNVMHYQAVVLAGSLPAGVPTDFYAQLIEIAHQVNIPVYLDGSGEALKKGLQVHPALIKPNQQEFADLVDSELKSVNDYLLAAQKISIQYETTVIVSLGEAGAIGVFRSLTYQALPPPVEFVSAVGSGDSLLAGIIFSTLRGGSLKEQVRCGVAAGTANTLQLGAGIFTAEQFEQIYAQVTFKA